jgi:hypothetical protein
MITNKLLLIALFISPLGFASPAFGDTFIGNGGNSTNLDLIITLDEIRHVYRNIEEYEQVHLCIAPSWHNNVKEVRLLSTLSSKQVKFCKKLTNLYANKIIELASKNGKIKFIWTDKKIVVATKSGGKNFVQAVANTKKKTITINEESFQRLDPVKRIALIIHELFHFIKINGKYSGDSDKIGPFKRSGHLFDTLGAAGASQGLRDKVFARFRNKESISRNYKKFWISLKNISQSLTSDEAKLLIAHEQLLGSVAELRFSRGNLSYSLSRTELSTSTKSTSITAPLNVSYQADYIGLGIHYRLTPHDDPFDRIGQIHYLFSLQAESGKHSYSLADASSGSTSTFGISDSATSVGFRANGEIQIPIIYGFWLNIGFGMAFHEFEFKEIDAKIGTKPSFISTIGASYGF